MFPFIKKVFFVAMTFFSFDVLSVNSLECVSKNNQECKKRSEIINTNNMSLYFILSVLKQIIAVEVVIISTIHMLNCVFQMLLKT